MTNKYIYIYHFSYCTGTARPVRRSTYPQSSPPGKGIIWQWEGDVRGQWHGYDMEIACLLEDFQTQMRQNPKSPLILDLSKSTLKIPYQIDFARLTQIRLETGRVRKIRRVTLKQAYPSGNGSTSTPAASTCTATSSVVVSGPSTSTSPQKRSVGTGVSPAKKLKSGDMLPQQSAPFSNVNHNIGMSSLSAFNTVTKSGSGSGSTSQNAIQNINNQTPASHGRPITRSYINTVVPTSSAAIHSNQLPYSHLAQNNTNFPNFPPNVNIGTSSQYGMQVLGMQNNISSMQPNYPTMPNSMMPTSSQGHGQGFYGGPNMPFGMFGVHHGLPGGSIMNMAQNR